MAAEFWGDVKKALSAWRVAPALPLMTAVLQLPFALTAVDERWGFAAMLTCLFYGGFVGTERLWYLRAWGGRSLTPREIWSATWAYLGRYVALSLLITIPYLVVWFVSALALGFSLDVETSLGQTINLVIVGILFDVALTFMTPALAFSTDKAQEGMRLGWRFLRSQGRGVVLYALAPPLLALALLQRTPPTSLPAAPRIGLAILGTLVYLLLKGATAAKYLRHHEVTAEPALSSVGEKVAAPVT